MIKSKTSFIVLTLLILAGFAGCKNAVNTDPETPIVTPEENGASPESLQHEHSWLETETHNPTILEPGSIHYSCECGATKQEPIATIFSVPSDENGVPLTSVP